MFSTIKSLPWTGNRSVSGPPPPPRSGRARFGMRRPQWGPAQSSRAWRWWLTLVALQGALQNAVTAPPKQKADSQPPALQTLMGGGPPRPDGSDRFFGMENIVGVRNEPPVCNEPDLIRIC